MNFTEFRLERVIVEGARFLNFRGKEIIFGGKTQI
jgi:hypothetical protein